MGLLLQLLISLDPLADSFVETLSSFIVGYKKNVRDDLRHYVFKSSDWFAPETSDINTILTGLGDAILKKLKGRGVDSVDIGLILYAKNTQSAELFLPLYRHLEHFLNVITTRRIYVIYPPPVRVSVLTLFRQNFKKLLEDASTTTNRLREIHLIIAPEESEEKVAPWSQNYQIESHGMLNLMGDCRARLDALLTNCLHPCCNASYGRLVFNRDVWHNYYIYQAKMDLTKHELIDENKELDSMVEQFVRDNSLLENIYKIGYSSSLTLGSLSLCNNLERDKTHSPTQGLFEKFALSNNNEQEHIQKSEDKRFDDIQERYRHFLAKVMDEDTSSLDGFERALYIHKKILDIIAASEENHPFLSRHVIQKDIVPLVNYIVRCINNLSGNGDMNGLEEGEQIPDSTVRLKIEQIQNAMQRAGWSGEKLCIRAGLSMILDNIKMMLDASMPDDIIKIEIEEAVKKSFEDLDNELNKLKTTLNLKKESLESLKRNYSWFHKTLWPIPYLKERQIIFKEIENINNLYKEWVSSVNAYLEAVSPFLIFYERVKLISEMHNITQERIGQAGIFLIEFDNAVRREDEEVKIILDNIPEGPEIKGVELSFLSKSNMEVLYSEAPVRIDNYIKNLLRDSDKTWGDWAISSLMKYLSEIDSYCASQFHSLPLFDLPLLMFKKFPNQNVERLKNLVKVVSEQLLPLCEEDPVRPAERHHHMIFGFPEDVTLQLKTLEPDIIHRNDHISRRDTKVDYVHNNDRMCLDLTLSLCGFKAEDILFWDVFGNK